MCITTFFFLFCFCFCGGDDDINSTDTFTDTDTSKPAQISRYRYNEHSGDTSCVSVLLAPKGAQKQLQHQVLNDLSRICHHYLHLSEWSSSVLAFWRAHFRSITKVSQRFFTFSSHNMQMYLSEQKQSQLISVFIKHESASMISLRFLLLFNW